MSSSPKTLDLDGCVMISREEPYHDYHSFHLTHHRAESIQHGSTTCTSALLADRILQKKKIGLRDTHRVTIRFKMITDRLKVISELTRQLPLPDRYRL